MAGCADRRALQFSLNTTLGVSDLAQFFHLLHPVLAPAVRFGIEEKQI